MGRAPCCEKMGLNKGPWTPEEDQILINYINTYGHANWRALPKQAGLLRCGKSCRLRWTNYLRPDIKRGNFTREEEETIINLHEMLGNRWSAIAARLPGRTDNEIKNVWHTHLKKRLLPQNLQGHEDTKRKQKKMKKLDSCAAKQEQQQETKQDRPLSPPQCSSDMSTLTTTSDHNNNEHNINNHDMSINNNNSSSNNDNNIVDSPGNNDLALDEDFWSEVLSADNSGETSDHNNFPATIINGVEQEFEFALFAEEGVHLAGSNSSTVCDGMDFWYDVYARAEELTGLLEL